jgi:hypothetical protein
MTKQINRQTSDRELTLDELEIVSGGDTKAKTSTAKGTSQYLQYNLSDCFISSYSLSG